MDIKGLALTDDEASECIDWHDDDGDIDLIVLAEKAARRQLAKALWGLVDQLREPGPASHPYCKVVAEEIAAQLTAEGIERPIKGALV